MDSIKANAAKWSIIDRVNEALFALWLERWVFVPKIMTDFIEPFDDLPDPRMISSKKHKLIDNSFITIATVRYGCAEREEIEGYGDKKENSCLNILVYPAVTVINTILSSNPLFLLGESLCFIVIEDKSTATLLTGMMMEWHLLEIGKNPEVLSEYNR